MTTEKRKRLTESEVADIFSKIYDGLHVCFLVDGPGGVSTVLAQPAGQTFPEILAAILDQAAVMAVLKTALIAGWPVYEGHVKEEE